MDYTNDILGILSSELEPYVSHGGETCIDGVLTSAQKLNEFIQQKLQQTPCYAMEELLALKLGEVMHYRSTCGNHDHAVRYDRMIEAINIVMEMNNELLPLSP